MGTEILRSYDILSGRRLGSDPFTVAAAASFLPRRRHTPSRCSAAGPNPRRQRRNRREGCAKPAKNNGGGGSNGSLEMGQVTILRRGESLSSKSRGGILGKGPKGGKRRGEEGAAGDLGVFGAGRIGPESAAVTRPTRLAEVRAGAEAARKTETYAGSAFSMSPSPRALPLPRFSSRRAAEGGESPVDVSATRDLMRLLRLD